MQYSTTPSLSDPSHAIGVKTRDSGGGATVEVIDEGSLLLGQACFPNDKISGNNGHTAPDVAYIVSALGDQQAALLQSALGLPTTWKFNG
ncbi:hypothetical protein DFH07DRAFT_954438 [Mycena maculata]|uniref:Endo-chitosanase n=1 Tax=Mycena maculata TaxID=230809 RepID=A0AAD7JRY4_9AGAR|nr:hypothetical protein DFH07DRAFT_954438 [Mycena maculata]